MRSLRLRERNAQLLLPRQKWLYRDEKEVLLTSVHCTSEE